MLDVSYTRIVETGDDLGAAVAGAVVDNDQLEVWVSLFQNGPYGPGKLPSPVVGR
jgi:hypothetical protein